MARSPVTYTTAALQMAVRWGGLRRRRSAAPIACAACGGPCCLSCALLLLQFTRSDVRPQHQFVMSQLLRERPQEWGWVVGGGGLVGAKLAPHGRLDRRQARLTLHGLAVSAGRVRGCCNPNWWLGMCERARPAGLACTAAPQRKGLPSPRGHLSTSVRLHAARGGEAAAMQGPTLLIRAGEQAGAVALPWRLYRKWA